MFLTIDLVLGLFLVTVSNTFFLKNFKYKLSKILLKVNHFLEFFQQFILNDKEFLKRKWNLLRV